MKKLQKIDYLLLIGYFIYTLYGYYISKNTTTVDFKIDLMFIYVALSIREIKTMIK